jgi:hypothetical protein
MTPEQMYRLKTWGMEVAEAQARGKTPPAWPEDIPRPLDSTAFAEAYDAAVANVEPIERMGALTRTDLRVILLMGLTEEAERDAYIAVLQMQSAEEQNRSLVRATWALVAATIALAIASFALIVATLVH